MNSWLCQPIIHEIKNMHGLFKKKKYMHGQTWKKYDNNRVKNENRKYSLQTSVNIARYIIHCMGRSGGALVNECFKAISLHKFWDDAGITRAKWTNLCDNDKKMNSINSKEIDTKFSCSL